METETKTRLKIEKTNPETKKEWSEAKKKGVKGVKVGAGGLAIVEREMDLRSTKVTLWLRPFIIYIQSVGRVCQGNR